MNQHLIPFARRPFFSGLFGTVVLLLASCTDVPESEQMEAEAYTASLLIEVSGFSGPEAVRYDPELDVYFVANLNGGAEDRDNNGFISRVSPDGNVDSLKFIEGGRGGVTLHAPLGMAISGDTLWAVDAGTLKGFNGRDGSPLATVDLSGFEVGFLNDVTVGPDGALYVTDTAKDRVYRVMGDEMSQIFEDSVLNRPNGITWDEPRGRFVVVPFGEASNHVLVWTPDQLSLQKYGSIAGAGLDGVEVIHNDDILIASQSDSSLYLLRGEEAKPIARLAGRPADIGYDTERHRVAVPYIARNVVEIWQLPH